MMPSMKRPPSNDTDSSLELLERLYRVGDYRQARALTRRLSKSADLSDKERSRVESVAASMRTDSGAIVAFVFTFLVLGYLVLKFGM